VGRQLLLGEREDLRGAITRTKQVVLVCRDVDAVLIGPDVRVVLEAWPRRRAIGRASVVRRSVGAIVLGRNVVDSPAEGRVTGVADGDVNRILAVIVAGRIDVECRYRDDKPLVLGVVVADRVDDVPGATERSIWSG
jgi:hypothetical protein